MQEVFCYILGDNTGESELVDGGRVKISHQTPWPGVVNGFPGRESLGIGRDGERKAACRRESV